MQNFHSNQTLQIFIEHNHTLLLAASDVKHQIEPIVELVHRVDVKTGQLQRFTVVLFVQVLQSIKLHRSVIVTYYVVELGGQNV